VVYVLVAGIVIAAVCGYMAGLIGASNSPISGVGILSVLGIAIVLALLFPGSDADSTKSLVAFALFVTTFHPSTDDLVSMQIQGALLLIILGLAMVFAVKFRPSGIGPPPGYPPASLSRPLR
jgi:hypothetical protein